MANKPAPKGKNVVAGKTTTVKTPSGSSGVAITNNVSTPTPSTPSTGKYSFTTGGVKTSYNTLAERNAAMNPTESVIPEPKKSPLVSTLENVYDSTVTKGQTYDSRAEGMVSGDYLSNATFAKEQGIGKLPYNTTEGMIAYNKAGQQEQRNYLASQQSIAKASENIQDQTTGIQTAAQIAATKAGMAQGREGVMSTGNPMVVGGVVSAIGRYKNQIALERQSAQLSREKASSDLQRAIDSDNTDLANALRGQIDKISTSLRQLDLDEADMAMKESVTAANVQKTKAETLQTTFDAMGAFATKYVDDTALQTMATDAGIGFGTAAAMRAMATAKGELANAKDQATVDETTAQIAQLQMEIDAGLYGPAQAQEFQYYSKLSDAQKSKYIELKNAGYEFTNIDGVGIVKIDKATGKGSVAFSTEELPDFTPADISINDIDVSKPGQNGILAYTRIYKGSSANASGVDFSAPVGTAVNSQLDGEVVSIKNDCKPGDLSCNGGWGNQVKIKDSNNNIHTYNHLETVNITADQLTVGIGDNIGQVGNTGHVMGGSGESLTGGQIAAGRGSHLDYTVYKPDGKMYSLEEAFKYANGKPVVNGFGTGMQEYKQRLDKANAGESTQVTKSNTEALKNAMKTGDETIIKETMDEIERKKYLPRVEKIEADFTAATKGYTDIKTATSKIDSLYQSFLDNPEQSKTFLDQGLITLYNKMLDPTSVVRESEYNRTAENLSLMNRMQGTYDKLLEGGAGLTNEDRKAAVDAAKILLKGAEQSYSDNVNKAVIKGEKAGVPANFVKGYLGIEEAEPEDATTSYVNNLDIDSIKANNYVNSLQ